MKKQGKRKINSAGLVYLSVCGSMVDGVFTMRSIDSYRYMGNAFCREALRSFDDPSNTVRILAMAGERDKTVEVFHTIEAELKRNYRRILDGKKIRLFSEDLDETGNAFCRCVQEI